MVCSLFHLSSVPGGSIPLEETGDFSTAPRGRDIPCHIFWHFFYFLASPACRIPDVLRQQASRQALELLALLDPIHPLSIGQCSELTAGVREQCLGETVHDAGVVATIITPTYLRAWCNFVVVRCGCWEKLITDNARPSFGPAYIGNWY